MATTVRDNLGFGSTLAPVGTPEWAKRWRIEFQTVAKRLPDAPQVSRRFYELGKTHRAWTMLTDPHGRPFPDFDAFCACPVPCGLGIEPAKFRAYLEAEIGKREADLITVSPGQQGERTDLEGTSRHDDGKSDGLPPRKHERLRAINRAAPGVQDLYREGYLNQTDAARLGPPELKEEEPKNREQTPEERARQEARKVKEEDRKRRVARATAEIDCLDRSLPKPEFRKHARAIIQRELGGKEKTTVDVLLAAWEKATDSERAEFLKRAGLVLKRP